MTGWASAGSATVGAFNLSLTFPAGIGNPTERVFSERVEGSSVNKAIEIFNGTGSTIDRAANGNSIEICFNGHTTAATVADHTGVIAHGDVLVLADDGPDALILAPADQLITGNLFNGDVAVALPKNNTVVDVIGQTGFEPCSQWGSGFAGTRCDTLRRQPFIQGGDTNGSDAIHPAVAGLVMSGTCRSPPRAAHRSSGRFRVP